MQRILELIEKTPLLSDFDGQMLSYDQLAAHEDENKTGPAHQIAELLALRGSTMLVAELMASEKPTLKIYLF